MTYSILAYAAVRMDWTENIIPLLSFVGHSLVKAGCCDSTIFALSKHATILKYLLTRFFSVGPDLVHGLWRFHNRRFFWSGVVRQRPNPNLEDQGLHLVRPLPFTSIALQVGVAPKPPLNDTAVVLEQNIGIQPDE
jgi:hypothetical protein